jgi:hypothetical protein
MVSPPHVHGPSETGRSAGAQAPPSGGAQARGGERWEEVEIILLRAYVAGQLSYAERQAQLPGRAWEGIAHQVRVLGLRLQRKPVYYRLELCGRWYLQKTLRGGHHMHTISRTSSTLPHWSHR